MIGISFVKHEPVEHSSKMIPSLSDANSNGKSLIEVMKEKRPSLVRKECVLLHQNECICCRRSGLGIELFLCRFHLLEGGCHQVEGGELRIRGWG